MKEIVNRMRDSIPEIQHHIIFYDNGTVFATDFDHTINIPKLGGHFSTILKEMKSIHECIHVKHEKFVYFHFAAEDHSVLITKFGSNGYIALFLTQPRLSKEKLHILFEIKKEIKRAIDVCEDEQDQSEVDDLLEEQ